MIFIGGIPLPHVFNASGARGFFGEGNEYWFHPIAHPFGLNFAKSAFVTKTSTADPLSGYMPLGGRDNVVVQEWFPKCIYVDMKNAAGLNAVGLANPGLQALLQTGRLQRRLEPTVISIMAVKLTKEERLDEFRRMAKLLRRARFQFMSEIIIEINFSCPNTKHNPHDLLDDIHEAVLIMSEVGAPIIVKLNALVQPATVKVISDMDEVSAICGTNTIPFGELADRIDWDALFGTHDPEQSPLRQRGLPVPGGLSGEPIFRVAVDWIRKLRAAGVEKYIIGGGGITDTGKAEGMINAGADAIFLGTVCFTRPHRVASIIRVGNRIGSRNAQQRMSGSHLKTGER